MFAGLPLDSRQLLERAARLVDVPAGTWLLREGDPPGSAYVVRRGRLEVSVGGQLVRELGPGEVLGELALLTGERRSASVRARRDSAVLEVPRGAFEDLLATDLSASRFVLAQVVERLRTAGGPPERPRPAQPTVIAVVGMHRGSGADEVAEVLRERLGLHGTVFASAALEPEGLDRAEADSDRVLLVADGDGDARQLAWRDFCVRQADAVVLVARADAETPVDVTPAPVRQPDVVLLGTDPGPAQRAAWVAATDAWQLTVVDGRPRRGPAGAGRPAGRQVARAHPGGRGRPGLRPRRGPARARPTPGCTSTGWPAAASAP